MSNLIKSVYFNVSRENKVVIDTNKKIEEMGIFKPQVEPEEESGFVPGLNVLNVEEIIEEERANFEEQANDILEEARQNAETMIEEARQQVEKISSEAYSEGFERGYSEGMQKSVVEVEQVKSEYAQLRAELENSYEQIVDKIEPQFAELVGELVEKLTGIVVDKKIGVIRYIIDRAMKNIPESDIYTIHVSNEDFSVVQNDKDKLASLLKADTTLNIVEDTSLIKNQCIIETDSSIIDASLDVQLENLKQELRLLSSF